MPLSSIDSDVTLLDSTGGAADDVFTPDALQLVARLHRAFDARRRELLAARVGAPTPPRNAPAGAPLDFPPETADIRAARMAGGRRRPISPTGGGDHCPVDRR